MWEKGSVYLKKMGGIILAFSIIIWFLGAFPRQPEKSGEHVHPVNQVTTLSKADGLDHTYIGHIGKFIEPALQPLGFDWQMGVALLTGFVAKEVVVSTMGVLYGVGDSADGTEAALIDGLRRSIKSPLIAYAFLVFVLLYTPCIVTIITIRRETGNWKWAVFAVGYELLLAWGMAFIIYRGGLLLGLG